MTQQDQCAAFEAQIELPPLVGTLAMLPDQHKAVIEAYGRACARQAIAHDRQQRGEVVITWDESQSQILAVTRQDEDGKILSVIAEAKPQQRGEPVAEVLAWRERFPSYEYRPQDECVALKLKAPQPAEPVKERVKLDASN